jgi:hypothetical protein
MMGTRDALRAREDERSATESSAIVRGFVGSARTAAEWNVLRRPTATSGRELGRESRHAGGDALGANAKTSTEKTARSQGLVVELSAPAPTVHSPPGATTEARAGAVGMTPQ